MGLNKSRALYEVPKLKKTIARFSKKAKKECPEWDAKLSSISFDYNGKEYEILPDDLGVSDAQFECVQQELSEQLQKIGLKNVFCVGFID